MKKTISIVLFLLVALFWVSGVSAQTSTTTPVSDQFTGTVVATVNIYNAKLVTQKGNTFNLSFDIFNQEGVQTGVKYSVRLVKLPQGDIADEKVYDEVLELGPDQTIKKSIVYTAPTALSGGSYQLLLRSNNDRGLLLGLANLGKVTIQTSKMPRVEILPESCYLTVKGEKPVKQYTLLQGVDIAQTEKLVATCKVFSSFTSATNLNPTFETRYRTVYGKRVDQVGGATTSIAVKVGTSTISFELPKALEPQAYDTLLSLINSDKTVSSNAVRFHYVLRGASGTIQNTVFDKSVYKKGDIANLQIFLTPSADAFPDSRFGQGTIVEKQTVKVMVVDGSGLACGQQTSNVKRSVVDVKIPVIIDCNNPKASISFEGVTADGKSQVLDTTQVQVSSPELETKNTWPVLPTIAIIVGLVLVVALILFRVHLHRKLNNVFVLAIVFGVSMMFGVDSVKALSTTYESWGASPIYYTFTTNLDKPVYVYGEDMIVTGDGVWSGCTNLTLKIILGSVAQIKVDGVNNGSPSRILFESTLGNDNGSGDYSLTFTNDVPVGDFHRFNIINSQNRNPLGTQFLPFRVVDTLDTNNPPALTITDKVIGAAGSPSSFTFDGTDPDGDKIKYAIDWDRNGSVDEYYPNASDFVDQGVPHVASYTWPTAGTYTFQAIVGDNKSPAGDSGWVQHTVNVPSAPPPTLTASLTASPDNGGAPLNSVVLTATRTGGTATGLLSYKFKCQNSDSWSASQASNVYDYQCSYPTVGTYTAYAEVTQEGVTATPTDTITVSNLSATLGASRSSGTISEMSSITLTATRDPASTATGPITYKFKCKDADTLSASQASNIYTCTNKYPTAGSYTAYAEVTQGGITATPTTLLTVNANPDTTVTLSANPLYVNKDQNNVTTLTWTPSNADSCTASGDWSGSKDATSGPHTENQTNLTSNKTYRITCNNSVTGKSDTKDVTVYALSLPTVDLTANPISVSSGGTSVLTWTPSNADSCTASGGWSGSKNATSGSHTEDQTNLTSDKVYTITCSNNLGSVNKSVGVAVTAVPLSLNLFIGSTPTNATKDLYIVKVGSPFALKWVNTLPVYNISSNPINYYDCRRSISSDPSSTWKTSWESVALQTTSAGNSVGNMITPNVGTFTFNINCTGYGTYASDVTKNKSVNLNITSSTGGEI